MKPIYRSLLKVSGWIGSIFMLLIAIGALSSDGWFVGLSVGLAALSLNPLLKFSWKQRVGLFIFGFILVISGVDKETAWWQWLILGLTYFLIIGMLNEEENQPPPKNLKEALDQAFDRKPKPEAIVQKNSESENTLPRFKSIAPLPITMGDDEMTEAHELVDIQVYLSARHLDYYIPNSDSRPSSLLIFSESSSAGGSDHIPGFDNKFVSTTYHAPSTIAFTYRDAQGNLSDRTIDIDGQLGTSYIKGWCHSRCDDRTFKISRIIGDITDTDTGELLSVRELRQKLKNPSAEYEDSDFYADTDNDFKTEICFTAFPSSKKEILEAIAWKSGYTVRTRVTKNLDYLCVGSGKAPAKIAQAESQGIEIIDEDEFQSMINIIA